MRRLEDKVVVLTGAAGGIGQAIAAACITEGARIAATDMREESMAAAASRCGDVYLPLRHDVRSEPDWRQVMESARAAFGRIDCVINNAGISTLGGAQDPENIELEHWRAIHAVNVEGVLLGCKAAIAAMKQSGGCIVNMSSIAGLRPSVMCAYGASKAAVRQLTRSVALYCCNQGYPIRCNSVHPGYVSTPMLAGSLSPQALEAQKQSIPLRRFALPEDIAAAVVYLCSDESAYVTGAKFVVDGGVLMD